MHNVGLKGNVKYLCVKVNFISENRTNWNIKYLLTIYSTRFQALIVVFLLNCVFPPESNNNLDTFCKEQPKRTGQSFHRTISSQTRRKVLKVPIS